MFRNIRIWPELGARVATVTWEIDTPGTVHVAVSPTGVPSSWGGVASAAAEVGTAVINEIPQLNSSIAEVWVRLLLEVAGEDDVLSDPIRLHNTIHPREVAVLHGILRRQFRRLWARNGFPVWHCVPLTSGTPSAGVDPDTRERREGVCDPGAYGMPFVGGFHPPILTWAEIVQSNRGTVTDDESGLGSAETADLQFRLFPFPRPARDHMLVCPATDRRFVLGDAIKGTYHRGQTLPVMFRGAGAYIAASDARYHFPVPELDVMAYRKIPYWSVIPT